MAQYAYVITGSWVNRTGGTTTETMSGTYDIDSGDPPITRIGAFRRISEEFARVYGITGAAFGVMFFSLEENRVLT